MKAWIINYRHTLTFLAVLAVSIAVIGCSEDNGGEDQFDEYADIETIILNPKSAAAGDTVVATVVLAGHAPPGSFPAVKWTKDGGAWPRDVNGNEIDYLSSVKWVAPGVSGVYQLECTVTTSANTDHMAVDVFVGQPGKDVAQNGGEIQLTAAQSPYYYLRTSTTDEAFDGASVYLSTGGEAAPGAPMGSEFSFSNDVTQTAYVVTVPDVTDLDEEMNVYLTDLSGSYRKLTTDRSEASSNRRQQYEYPYFSPLGDWVTYQGFLPNPQSGFVDTLDVFVYNLGTDEETNVTELDTLSAQRRNLWPTYSTDFNWLVFVTDRVADLRDEWDLYAQPINGGVVDPDLQETTRLTTKGMIGLVPFEQLRRPTIEWNPTSATVAVVAASGTNADELLHLVDPNGPQTTTVYETGSDIVEISWSADGQLLAVSATFAIEDVGVVNSLFTVSPGGAATQRHAAVAGDKIYDLGWAPNNSFLVYRVARGAASWFELLDIDAGTNLLRPLVITTSVSLGNRSTFAAEMSTAARYWSDVNTDIVYYLQFDGASPAIWSLDISGVTP